MLNSRLAAFIVATVGIVIPSSLFANGSVTRSWHDGVPVQYAESRIEILTVSDNLASDFDYAMHMQGAIYFNDCLNYINHGRVATKRIQFMFATVSNDGYLKGNPLPLDIRVSALPGILQGAVCRDHAYANGYGGLWLVAWVNVVEFADGTSWQAPPANQMADQIKSSLPRASFRR